LDVRYLKIAIKALSDPKIISPLARKVLEVPISLEMNFSTIEVGLHQWRSWSTLRALGQEIFFC